MNVLVLGARIIGPALAFDLVDAFLEAKFQSQVERYVRRLNKVLAIEARNMNHPATPASGASGTPIPETSKA